MKKFVTILLTPSQTLSDKAEITVMDEFTTRTLQNIWKPLSFLLAQLFVRNKDFSIYTMVALKGQTSISQYDNGSVLAVELVRLVSCMRCVENKFEWYTLSR
jgi:hypothetical protein